jgi:cleavage and polyadenylation specificity factor subunit 3
VLLALIKWALEGTFGSIDELPVSRAKKLNGDTHMNGSIEEADEEISKHTTAYMVMGCVIVRHSNNGEVDLEWEGNMLNDGIADAVMAVLFSVESSPAAVKRMSPSTFGSSNANTVQNPRANIPTLMRLPNEILMQIYHLTKDWIASLCS